jgi:3D (Asp-Asp-Asp) domain-containing protein
MPIRALAFAAVLTAVTAAAATGSSVQAPLQLRATLYYVALEPDYPPGNSAAFLDVHGAVLRQASPEFYAAATTEGTARFSDGEVLNLAGAGNAQWQTTAAPYGLSTTGCNLEPFRSAAVDPHVIPLGSQLFIPETAGIQLADGSVHDGMWLATDTGPYISGDRIDLFTGAGYASMNYMERVGIKTNHMVSVQVLGPVPGCELTNGHSGFSAPPSRP